MLTEDEFILEEDFSNIEDIITDSPDNNIASETDLTDEVFALLGDQGI